MAIGDIKLEKFLQLTTDDLHLDIDTGNMVIIHDEGNAPLFEKVPISEISQIFKGADTKRIDFILKNSEKQVESINGYLIEVFVKNSDGHLVRIRKDKVVDPITNEDINDSYENYFYLEFDVKE